ncbi:MAG TPA: serine/threonine-protein kinase, partial [Kofleriaceae bacterium]
MAEIHIDVGIAALSRGFITHDAFVTAVAALSRSNGQSVHELWVGQGHMTDAQLAQVLDLLGKTSETIVLAATGSKLKPEDVITNVAHKARAKMPTQQATAPTAASLIGEPPPPDPALLDPATDRLKAGAIPDLIGNRYKKLSMLGKGGLGEVLACDDIVLQRTVAVKAGHTKGDVDSYSAKVILAREARIISCLEHPNIIPIYDAGTDAVRGPFYVMRQVTETSLEMILHQRKLGDGNPHDYTLNRLLRYFLQVCNAVDYAHHRGVIHCDIKPANILLGDYGEVLLVDWGLAQSRNHPLGVRGGTLGYMAPEQMDPTIERLDWRTDVFALGAIIYEILCGVPAFEDARSSDLTAVGKDPKLIYKLPLAPSARDHRLDIPKEVEDVCMQAIAV